MHLVTSIEINEKTSVVWAAISDPNTIINLMPLSSGVEIVEQSDMTKTGDESTYRTMIGGTETELVETVVEVIPEKVRRSTLFCDWFEIEVGFTVTDTDSGVELESSLETIQLHPMAQFALGMKSQLELEHMHATKLEELKHSIEAGD